MVTDVVGEIGMNADFLILIITQETIDDECKL